MATKANPGPNDCYAKAEPDEPLFTLLARDRHAPALVFLWSTMRELDGENLDTVKEARDCVNDMLTWASTHGRPTCGFGFATIAGVLELIRFANVDRATINEPTSLDAVRRALNAATKGDIVHTCDVLGKTVGERDPLEQRVIDLMLKWANLYALSVSRKDGTWQFKDGSRRLVAKDEWPELCELAMQEARNAAVALLAQRQGAAQYETWTLVENIPETGERRTSLTRGNARVRLVAQGVASDLASAEELLKKGVVIDLPETPTKFPGRLWPYQ